MKKFYQELLKESSNPRLKGNRKGIIVKGKGLRPKKEIKEQWVSLKTKT